MNEFDDDYELLDEDIFADGRIRPQPRKRVRGVSARKNGKVRHGEAEIGLVMDIKHVTRAQAIKILDERAARLKAKKKAAEEDNSLINF